LTNAELLGQETLTKKLVCELVLSRNLDKNAFITRKSSIKQGLPMEKKALFAVAFISVLLLSIIAGILLANMATADPIWGADFPREPDVTPPTIILNSPLQNQSFNSTDIQLNFTVAKPETWFKENSNLWVLGKITSVSYEVDTGEKQSLPVYDTATYSVTASAYPPRNLNFSLGLTLPEGTHNITVGVEAESYYVTPGYLTGPPFSITFHGEPESTNFTVAQPKPEIPEKEPFSIVPVVSIASVVIVSVVLLVYFKKREH
jgi:hypothetical protein